MPRTTIAAQSAPGSVQYTGTALTFTAADVANKNQTQLTGTEMIIGKNVGASAHTVTITSFADPFGRTKDIPAISLVAGEERMFGPFKQQGWKQTDGFIYFEANHLEIEFAIIRMPA